MAAKFGKLLQTTGLICLLPIFPVPAALLLWLGHRPQQQQQQPAPPGAGPAQRIKIAGGPARPVLPREDRPPLTPAATAIWGGGLLALLGNGLFVLLLWMSGYIAPWVCLVMLPGAALAFITIFVATLELQKTAPAGAGAGGPQTAAGPAAGTHAGRGRGQRHGRAGAGRAAAEGG